MNTSHRLVRLLFAGLATCALAACGGGGSDAAAPAGSGGSTGTVLPANLRVVLDKASIDVSAAISAATQPTSRITVTLENTGDSKPTVRVLSTRRGLSNVLSTLDGAGLVVLLYFMAPYDLLPGVYADTLTFDVCPDSSCASTVASLRQVVTTQYTVLPATGVNAASIAWPTNAITVQALTTDAQVPGVGDVALVSQGLNFTPTLRLTTTGDLVVSTSTFQRSTPADQVVRINPRPPRELGAGLHTATITLVACFDQNCVNPVPGSPQTLAVQVNVADGSAGPTGYTVSELPFYARDMVWAPGPQRLYISAPDPTPSGLGTDHSIRVVNPATGAVVASQAISWRPGPLAISDDDQYLYVGAFTGANVVQRLRVLDLSLDASLPLGTGRDGLPLYPREISVAPHAPKQVAVARVTNPEGPTTAGLVVYDDVVPRPTVLADTPDTAVGPVIDRVTWGPDASTLFASNYSGSTPEVYRIVVDTTGPRLAQRAADPGYGPLGSAAGLFYTSRGTLFDAVTLTPAGALLSPLPANVFVESALLEPARNRAFVVRSDILNSDPRQQRRLAVLNLSQRTTLASIPLDPRWYVLRMARYGTDGLALLVDDGAIPVVSTRIVLISGGFISQ